MIRPSLLLLSFLFLFFVSACEAKTLDPYKILGVDKNASQRDIQKAFHKLSLQYHPDKNKNKGAQEKFAEINNAYEILSDEKKKKNYDLYGDEKGNPGYDGGDVGNHDGYFTSGGPGAGPFTSGPGGWQTMGGQGNTKTFSFSFAGDSGSGGSPFGFDFGDMFSNLFSGGRKASSQRGGFSKRNQYEGFADSSGSKSEFAFTGDIEDINSQYFNKHIKDRGMTWLFLFYIPSVREGYQVLESIAEDVATSLQGAIKAGKINCITEKTLCRDLGVSPSRSAQLFIYSFRDGARGSLVQYTGELDSRALKNFCLDQLPRFSKRVDLDLFDFSSSTKEKLPQVLLLSTKKDTPSMWRAISGLYHNRFIFYNAEVHDVSHPMLRRLGVDALPAVVGRLSNGEELVLRAGIAVKDLKSGVQELSALLERFEMKNNKVASDQSKKASQSDSGGKRIPHLTMSNLDEVCGDKTALCVIGVHRSSRSKGKLEAILSEVSRKTLVRRQNLAHNSGDSISYSLLDAAKQSQFLYSFDSTGYKSSDKLLLAYKPRKGKFAVYTGDMTMEEVEKFVSSVLSGDVRFSNVRQKPVLR